MNCNREVGISVVGLKKVFHRSHHSDWQFRAMFDEARFIETLSVFPGDSEFDASHIHTIVEGRVWRGTQLPSANLCPLPHTQPAHQAQPTDATQNEFKHGLHAKRIKFRIKCRHFLWE